MNGSTWRLIKEEGLLGFFRGRTLHGYVYLRWIKPYVRVAVKQLLPILPRPAKQYLKNRYHAKLLTQEEAEAIITIDRSIELHKVPEQLVPFKYVRDIVIKEPHDIAVIDCACRSAQDNDCHPRQVCMIIGQPFVDFVLDQQGDAARRISQEEAIQLLKDERDRGHMHCAWFKDACLGRFYAICNCCPCCCSGLKAMHQYDTKMVASSGYVSTVAADKCDNCGKCVERCPFHAIESGAKQAEVNWETCMGCGVCESVCPNGAHSLYADEAKGLPFDVRVLGK
jgi:NAD-dependent dihydropyrimidine dehydrogenase PreA subunit